MDQKAGKVARLEQLNPSAPGYAALLDEIRLDLQRLDKGLNDAILGRALK